MTSFNIEDYKQMVEVLKGERDYEHNRFLDEQIKRSDLQEENKKLNEARKKFCKENDLLRFVHKKTVEELDATKDKLINK